MADASHIGRELGTETFPVERSKLRELAIAGLDPDPLYVDPQAAEAAGLDGLAVPLNWPVLVMHWRRDMAGAMAELGLDLRRVLHGEVRWEYRAPVRVGDEITARRRVADVTTREGSRGGTMTFVSVEMELTNQRGEVVAVQTDTIIETGG